MTHIILFVAVLLIALITLAAPAVFARFGKRSTHGVAVNVGEVENDAGVKAFTPAAVITTRNLLHKIGASATESAICGANDIPIGAIEDEVATDEVGESRTVKLLGIYPRTMKMVASEAISAGAAVFTAANGKVQDLPAGAGTYYQVGYALTAAAADGRIIEVQHHAPIKTVVA